MPTAFTYIPTYMIYLVMIATSKAGVDLLNNFKTTSKKVTYKKKSIYNKMKIHSKQTLFKILKLLPKQLLTKTVYLQ